MSTDSKSVNVAVVYFCHDGEGNYLFNKRSKKCRDEVGRWDCGGGRLEFGEKVENCLKKELAEEYCIKPISFEFLGFRDVHRKNKGVRTHWIALDFRVLVDRKKVKNGEPHKFDAICWFKLEELPKNLHSQISLALDMHKEKLK
jgi:ADP-ribose pyrophosphatase YjhB (NUDIX family)